MRPITIQWPAFNATSIVNNATYNVNVPLTFTNSTYISTPTSAQPVLSYVMPPNTVRNITITSNPTSTVFLVNGLDEYGNALTEELEGNTYVGSQKYASIQSITAMSPATTGTVNVGYAALGRTVLQRMDKHNLNNNYTIAYQNVSTGSISLTPYFTLNDIQYYEYSVQKNIQTLTQNPSIYYPLPLSNPNFIVSPSTITAAPITTNCSISFVGIPLTGLLTNVDSLASFTQVILQQGVRF